MSKLPVTIDYRVAASVLSGMETQCQGMLKWIRMMKRLLDKAAQKQGEEHGKSNMEK